MPWPSPDEPPISKIKKEPVGSSSDLVVQKTGFRLRRSQAGPEALQPLTGEPEVLHLNLHGAELVFQFLLHAATEVQKLLQRSLVNGYATQVGEAGPDPVGLCQHTAELVQVTATHSVLLGRKGAS